MASRTVEKQAKAFEAERTTLSREVAEWKARGESFAKELEALKAQVAEQVGRGRGCGVRAGTRLRL